MTTSQQFSLAEDKHPTVEAAAGGTELKTKETNGGCTKSVEKCTVHMVLQEQKLHSFLSELGLCVHNTVPSVTSVLQGQIPLQLTSPASHLAVQGLLYVIPSTPQTTSSTSLQSQRSAQYKKPSF